MTSGLKRMEFNMRHSQLPQGGTSTRPVNGMLQNESILIQDPDRVDKMEETIKALTQKVVELQQQGNTTMGTLDLLNIMEMSNSNLGDKLASQKP